MKTYNLRDELIKSLMNIKNVKKDTFTTVVIKDKIAGIADEKLQAYYAEVAETEAFGDGLSVILRIANKYLTVSKADVLLSNMRETAKVMYDKYYDLNCGLTDFAQENREMVADDREFFKQYNYAEQLNIHGEKYLNSKELYVLNALGGGNWLIDIRFATNSEKVIAQIEKVIKKTVEKKYLFNVNNSIKSKQVNKLLRRA